MSRRARQRKAARPWANPEAFFVNPPSHSDDLDDDSQDSVFDDVTMEDVERKEARNNQARAGA